MVDCTFKDLVIDAEIADRSAAFWAAALGLSVEPAQPATDAVLVDEVAEHTVWINQVPEPRTVKQRVHLDVYAGAIADLVALGATVQQTFERWTVMRDPEGGEFCAFLRPPESLPRYRLYELGVDATDPEQICRWWGDRFDLEPEPEDDDCWALAGGSLPWPMVFAAVPEPKQVKNRIHFDVWGVTSEIVAAGATALRPADDRCRWDVLADPEGNEFCVFARP